MEANIKLEGQPMFESKPPCSKPFSIKGQNDVWKIGSERRYVIETDSMEPWRKSEVSPRGQTSSRTCKLTCWKLCTVTPKNLLAANNFLQRFPPAWRFWFWLVTKKTKLDRGRCYYPGILTPPPPPTHTHPTANSKHRKTVPNLHIILKKIYTLLKNFLNMGVNMSAWLRSCL